MFLHGQKDIINAYLRETRKKLKIEMQTSIFSRVSEIETKERISLPMKKQFCLVSEPWIKAMDPQNHIQEYSLKEILFKAPDVKCLTGELPNQDFAILRLLLAVIQTVVYRYDADGNRSNLTDPDEAFKRWKAIWNAGHLPKKEIDEYLFKWESRFNLFDPVHPFYQIPSLIPGKPGTSISAGRLIGAVGESDNKSRFFASYSFLGKLEITDAELARWIIHFQAYDTKATKTSRGPLAPDQEKPHPRICWCGNLGAVYLEGNNLFETIMLNLVLLRTDTETDMCFGSPKPTWEQEPSLVEDRIRDDIDNQAELLSLQGRWLYLRRENGVITASAVVGENLTTKNAFMEQMTLWTPIYAKQKDGMQLDGYAPYISDYTKETLPDRTHYGQGIWNRFSAILSDAEDTRKPGIILWIKKLMEHHILPEDRWITIKGVDTVYHKQQGSSVMDVKTNATDMRLKMFGEHGKEWRNMLTDTITLINRTASLYGLFYLEVNEAIGRHYSGDTFGARFEGAEAFYSAIDAPFRKWLSQMNDYMSKPQEEEVAPETFAKDWECTMFRVADKIAKEKISSYGEHSVAIRLPNDENDFTSTNITAAYRKFWFSLKKHTKYVNESITWNVRVTSNRGAAVKSYVQQKIDQYVKNGDNSEVKNEIALLKRYAGKRMEDAPEAYSILLDDFPWEYKSDKGYTRAERAVFAACTLYASNARSMRERHEENVYFGNAARNLALKENADEDPVALRNIVKYFNRILTAVDFDTLMTHLTRFCKYASSHADNQDFKFDYAMLAYDLFTFQIDDYRMATKIMWANDFLSKKMGNKVENTAAETAEDIKEKNQDLKNKKESKP